MSEQGRCSPEDEFLMMLARGSLTPEIQARARDLLARGLNWRLILDQPQSYRVLPLVHRHLRALGSAGIPAEVRTELEALDREVAALNALAVRELVEILRLFDQARIPAIPLKGMALAESLYGDVTSRVSADIDILVPRAMVGRAIAQIATMGYRAESAAQWSERRLLKSFIEYAFARQDRFYGHELDLHWGILWWSPLDKGAIEDLWSEARPEIILGVPAYALSPEWEFLFLAAHAARDGWIGLKWLADIQAACDRGGIDWDRVWEKAERFEWQEVLELTASVCRYLIGTTPAFAKGAVREVPSWLKPFIQTQQPPGWLFAMVHLHLLRHNSERLRYVLHGLFIPTSSDWEFINLPACLSFLYYPVRVFRLGLRSTSWLISAVRAAIFRKPVEAQT